MKLESGTETNGAPTAVARPIPPEIQELLGLPPLLPNEDTKLYYALLGSLAQTIRPTDVIAWLLIRDLADHRIEIARYRRFKPALIKAPYDKKAEKELSDRRHTIQYICAELKKSAEEEKKVLAKSGKTPAEIEHLKQGIDNRVEAELAKAEILKSEAEAKLANASPSEAEFVKEFHLWIDQHERVDRLLRAAEDRFSAALEELDRHIRGMGPFLRERWKTIEGELAASEPLDESSSMRSTTPNSRRISSQQNGSADSPQMIVPGKAVLDKEPAQASAQTDDL